MFAALRAVWNELDLSHKGRYTDSPVSVPREWFGRMAKAIGQLEEGFTPDQILVYNSHMLEITTNQQLVTLRRSLLNESVRLSGELAKWPSTSDEHKRIVEELSVVSGLFSQVEGYRPPSAITTAVALPGTNGGFTHAIFRGDEVPAGSKVFAAAKVVE
jgi:hypothetical protein